MQPREAPEARGALVVDGARASLTFHRTYRHRREHVWDAIATPEGLRGWLLCTHAEIEARAGGRITLVSGPAAYRSEGRVLAWAPPVLLEYEWNVAPVPEMPEGQRAVFRFELEADGPTTHLTVIYRRLTLATARGFLPGVHAFLDRLAAQLDGVELPDFVARFRALLAEYPAWEGHATDPGE